MDPHQQWLLRIGLTLTLVASLFITPDLVGIARWGQLQRRLSRWADEVANSLRKRAPEPNADGGWLSYLSMLLADVAGGIVLIVVTVAVAIVLATIVPAFLVGAWLGQLVLAAWAGLFVVTATAIEGRTVLNQRQARGSLARVARLAASPAIGSVRLAALLVQLLAIAVLQGWLLLVRRSARASGTVADTLARDGKLVALLLPAGLACLVVGTVLQLLATL